MNKRIDMQTPFFFTEELSFSLVLFNKRNREFFLQFFYDEPLRES